MPPRRVQGAGGAGAGAWTEAALKCNAAAGSIHAAEVNCSATPALCDGVLAGSAPFAANANAKVKVFPFGGGKAEAADVMGDEAFDVADSGEAYAEAAESLPDKTLKVAAADPRATLAEKTLANDFLSGPNLHLHHAPFQANGMMLDSIMAAAAKAGRMILILGSNKDEPPTILKQLAIATEAAVDVVFMPEPDAQIMQKFQV